MNSKGNAEVFKSHPYLQEIFAVLFLLGLFSVQKETRS